ncbi:SDR family NAD(P)-dependent oxidoreductase [Acidithiobacillus sulfuriphilus]|uniref:SDR family NAD(P)-dependent oxidoreductase n=1 Tax=Acidithiobacillus sulfuriphilus TaxID=1867749 RepID=UPI003F618775
MITDRTKIAVITGASSDIGEATARLFAKEGYLVILGARCYGKVRAIAESIGGVAIPLDVSRTESVEKFSKAIHGPLDLLVNNGGGALGLGTIAEMDEDKWITMYQTNVVGLGGMTRALLPQLKSSEYGADVVNIGSITGLETYVGRAGYTDCKHAVQAITQTMRLEWLGERIRVTGIDPGLVETESSLVRFAGNAGRAQSVYQGMRPLLAEDVAESIRWAVSRPWHVNIDQIVIKPTDQARMDKIFRRSK